MVSERVFPQTDKSDPPLPRFMRGLTKRELAAMINQAAFAAIHRGDFMDIDAKQLAAWAVQQADALLAELEKPK